ncbi:hypothetical protein BD779DRAFT_1672781 [Infundibulicybe gibba]|nr:hypothetical protein BD779DRAFT_1672781 [Infundibulicybe gibba]
MEILQNRLESFSKSRRLKNPSKPSTSTTVKWPHPKNFKATPASLAEAGFYYTPSFEDRDSVTCFMCNKELSDWDAEDDPFDIHWQKCGRVCCWASVRCGLREDMDEEGSFIFPDDARLPSSKAMEKARLETFTAGEGWIHDKTRNHSASSKKMARAGFVYTPQHPGDDLATCLYCNISLSGWDKDDDPMQEHRAREEKLEAPCPFFSIVESTSAPDSRPPSRSQSKPPSRTQSMSKPSKSKHKDIALPTKTHDGDPEPDPLSIQASTSKIVRKTPRKPRSTSGTTKTPKESSTRSRSRGELKHVEEETEEDDSGSAPPLKVKKARSKSVSRSRSVLRVEEDETEEAEHVAPKRHTRTRSKAKLILETEDEEENQTIGKKVKRTKTTEGTDEEAGEILARKAVRGNSKVKYLDGPEDMPPKPTRSKPTMNGKGKPPHLHHGKLPVRNPSRIWSMTHQALNLQRKISITKPKINTTEPPESDMDVDLDLNGEIEREPEPEETQQSETPLRIPTQSTPKNKTSSDAFSVQQKTDDTNPPMMDVSETETHESRSQRTKLATEDDMVIEQQDGDLPLRDEAEPAERMPTPPAKSAKTKGDAHLAFTKLSTGRASSPDFKIRFSEKNPGTAPPLKKASTIDSAEVIEGVQVVEISTDEEGENDDGRGKSTKPPRSTTSPIEHSAKVDLTHSPQESAKTPLSETTETTQVVAEPTLIDGPILESIAGDVQMGDTSPRDVETAKGENPPPPTCPVTPPPNNHIPPTSVQPPHPPPVTFPPLSKLPFTPIADLTDAEMDMTVEEWVRYQMDVEYDKFKRDGEREVGRFKKRAEEVRRLILEL